MYLCTYFYAPKQQQQNGGIVQFQGPLTRASEQIQSNFGSNQQRDFEVNQPERRRQGQEDLKGNDNPPKKTTP